MFVLNDYIAALSFWLRIKSRRILSFEVLKNFSESANALIISFFWGFFSATFFALPFTMFFMFTSIFSPLYGFFHGLVGLLGATIGSILMYNLANTYTLEINTLLARIPGINQALIDKAKKELLSNMDATLIWQYLKGVPIKIYSVQAGILSLDFKKVIFMPLPVGLIKISLAMLIVVVFLKLFRKSIQTYSHRWVYLYFIGWIIFYLFSLR